jgi:hypothetical protein
MFWTAAPPPEVLSTVMVSIERSRWRGRPLRVRPS